MFNLQNIFHSTHQKNQDSVQEEIPKYQPSLREYLQKEITNRTKRSESPLGRVLHYWNGNPKMRIAVGLGLLSGGVVATATGAMAAAGIILGVRAGISALGAFTATTGILDIIHGKQEKGEIEQLLRKAEKAQDMTELEPIIAQIESKHRPEELSEKLQESMQKQRAEKRSTKIIATTMGAIAGILSLSGGIDHVVSAENIPPDIPSNNSSISMLKTSIYTPGNISISGASNFPSVSEIAEDIRHDHPKQGWVSLEQMVRRVEGCKMGIGLGESEKLVHLNSSVSKIVHDPSGIIAESLRNRGYDTSLGIDAICRKLPESEICSIVGDYIHETGNLHQVAIDTPSVSHIPVPTPHPIDVQVPTTTSMTSSPDIESQVPPVANGEIVSSSISPVVKFSALAVGGLGIAGLWKLWKKRNTMEKSFIGKVDEAKSPGIEKDGASKKGEETQESQPEITKPETEKQKITEEVIQNTPLQKSEKLFELSESGERTRTKIRDTFPNAYEWTLDEDFEQVDHDSYIEAYNGETLGGTYRIFVKYTNLNVQVTIVWYDQGIARKHVQSEFLRYSNILSPNHVSENLESYMDALYLEMLSEREACKIEDLETITSVSVPKGHLKHIYEHLEAPEIRELNQEVLGYWTACSYRIHDETLPLDALSNPKLNEQEFSYAWCRPKDSKANTKYNFTIPSALIQDILPQKEAELILKKRTQELNENRVITFTGAACSMNWHKHPDGITRPSSGDISEAEKDIRIQYPGRTSYFYAIVTRIPEQQTGTIGLKTSQGINFSKEEFGGVYNYQMRAFLMGYKNGRNTGLRELKMKIQE